MVGRPRTGHVPLDEFASLDERLGQRGPGEHELGRLLGSITRGFEVDPPDLVVLHQARSGIHRLLHTIPVLWPLHALHHCSRNYYCLIGMLKSHVGRIANRCTLAHIKRYNLNWGIPIAPEAWSREPAPWGDQFSNFNLWRPF